MKTIIAFLLIPFASFSQSGIAFFEGSWSELLHKAQTEKKSVFVDCYTDWCGPCKWMAKNVFPNDTAGAFYNEHFVNYQLDMEKGEGPEIAKRYEVKAYPTLLYIDAGGEALHKTVGRLSTAEFVAGGEDALNPEKRIGNYEKKYNAGDRGYAFINEYAAALKKSGDWDKAEIVVNTYLESLDEKELIQKENWALIKGNQGSYGDKIYQYVLDNKSAFAGLHGKEVNDYLYSGAMAASWAAGEKKDTSALPAILKILEQTAEPEKVEAALVKANKYFYMAAEQWNEYAGYAVAFIEKGYYKIKLNRTPEMDAELKKSNSTYEQAEAERNATILNNTAWDFYEHVDDTGLLTKAEDWIKLSVQLAENYYNLDTYTAVLFKLGKKKEGKQMAKKAIAKAKEQGVEPTSTKELLEKYK